MERYQVDLPAPGFDRPGTVIRGGIGFGPSPFGRETSVDAGGLRMALEERAAGRQGDAGPMVSAHAVHGDADRAEGFGGEEVCHG